MQEPVILAGAEPFYAENGPVGVLVSHGYTGNPQSMRPLAEGLAAAGFTVALPRLKGHGTTPTDMATSTASDWIADLEKATSWLQERCTTLFVTGLSMGGTLSLFMAGQHPDLFAGVLPINPILFANNPIMASLAFLSPAPVEVPGVGNDIKAEGVTELAYPVIPVSTIKELYALMKVTDELLPQITCPAQLFVSRDDHVVLPANSEYVFQKLSNADKKLIWLENSYHVATLDNDKDLIIEQSIAFIRTHSS